MRIPHTHLAPHTLRAVIEEFVTRDGTDYSDVDRRIEVVIRQLESGRVVLHFDDETGTCNIVSSEESDHAEGDADSQDDNDSVSDCDTDITSDTDTNTNTNTNTDFTVDDSRS